MAHRGLKPLFIAAVFVSAALLLFSMQPMFGKMILPTFGGSPTVWITSLVFFQLMLLAGYLYVHVTSGRLGQPNQASAHAALLLCVPLVALPIRDVTSLEQYEGKLPSVWVMLARSKDDLGAIDSDAALLIVGVAG